MQVLLQAIKSVLFFIVSLWKRALCCFRRRRRMSCDSVPLTAVGVISDFPRQAGGELENWNNWEDNNTNYKPNSIQEHIEYYRQQAMAARSISETEEETKEDFFQDMTPRITRQAKVFVDSGENDASKPNPSRLSLAPQAILVPEGELGEWEENSGWEEQTNPDWDPQTVLREKRRQERERRIWEQQQRKQEKVMRPVSLGAKIS